ncbi:cupin domain-containing protein [Pelagibius marinus]|uniref:cupin domain-containing protein n=1 Tax=Pelagibius marinus TaxID=2762760 RepID=UPI001872A7EF|nr:cupin domain-containing protein [Pelagibius marinus]
MNEFPARKTSAGFAAGGGMRPAPPANAGGCPADKVADNPLKDAATMPAGVTDTVLTSIDLSEEAVKLNDRLFRLRRLEVQPGGVVPMHAHGDRPALIYIISGTVTEYSSRCSVPIVHKAGEAAMESIGLTHWWKNTGKEAAVLISADLFHTEAKDEHVM